MDELTDRERLVVQLASGLSGRWMMPDALDDYHLTDEETAAVWALTRALLEAARERKAERAAADRRARGLLRSYLTPDQRHQLRTGKAFRCRGSEGGVYRLTPKTATVERVEQHGRKFFATRSFCLHDYAVDSPDRMKLPPADVSLTHLLLLSADERAFLKAANATDRMDQLWNRDYLRRMRERRAA